MTDNTKGWIAIGVVSVLAVATGYGCGGWNTAKRHCESRGFEEFILHDTGEIKCVKVTREPQENR